MAKLIRFPTDLEKQVDDIAKRERRTFTAQVLLMVERQLATEAKQGS